MTCWSLPTTLMTTAPTTPAFSRNSLAFSLSWTSSRGIWVYAATPIAPLLRDLSGERVLGPVADPLFLADDQADHLLALEVQGPGARRRPRRVELRRRTRHGRHGDHGQQTGFRHTPHRHPPRAGPVRPITSLVRALRLSSGTREGHSILSRSGSAEARRRPRIGSYHLEPHRSPAAREPGAEHQRLSAQPVELRLRRPILFTQRSARVAEEEVERQSPDVPGFGLQLSHSWRR